MAPLRAPLFSVSLAFAMGCIAGLEQWLPLTATLAGFALVFLAWAFLPKNDHARLAAFFLLTALAGAAHTELSTSTITRDDLRRLPDEKAYPTTQWRGVVIQEPIPETATHPSRRALERTDFVFRVRQWRPTGGRLFDALTTSPWQPADGDVACSLLGSAADLACGDELIFSSSLEPFGPPLVPGSLDYPAFEARQGIYFQAIISPQNWRREQHGGGDFWQDLSFKARDWSYRHLQIGLEDDPRIADFLAGMIIGYRQQIPADIEQDFRRTGTLHVFAVSGQNIAELMVVAVVLLQLVGLVRWRWGWLLAPIILLYCLLTGSPASAVRATVMIFLVLTAWRLGRPLNARACWSLAFLGMLVWQPAILEDPGAQLSFGVVLGLILLGPPLARLLERPFLRDPFLPRELLSPAQAWEERFWRRTALLLGATIAATVVSEPITAFDFHQVTPVSVLANLVVVPLAGLITVVGTLALTSSLVSTSCAALFNNANWLFAKVLIVFVGFLAHEPGASLNVPDLRTLNAPLPTIVIAPVQDSACLLLLLPGKAWLFNTGRETPARGATSHLLQYYGVNRLEGLVLTQIGVADNGGAEIITHDFRPRRLVLPMLTTHSPLQKTLTALVGQARIPVERWKSGDHFQFAPGASVDVLNPLPTGSSTRSDDRGLVLLFHLGRHDLLWAGRVGPAQQEQISNSLANLHAALVVINPQAMGSGRWPDALKAEDVFQLPLHDSHLNISNRPSPEAASHRIWPLQITGSVEITFHEGRNASVTILKPWAGSPILPTEN